MLSDLVTYDFNREYWEHEDIVKSDSTLLNAFDKLGADIDALYASKYWKGTGLENLSDLVELRKHPFFGDRTGNVLFGPVIDQILVLNNALKALLISNPTAGEKFKAKVTKFSEHCKTFEGAIDKSRAVLRKLSDTALVAYRKKIGDHITEIKTLCRTDLQPLQIFITKHKLLLDKRHMITPKGFDGSVDSSFNVIYRSAESARKHLYTLADKLGKEFGDDWQKSKDLQQHLPQLEHFPTFDVGDFVTEKEKFRPSLLQKVKCGFSKVKLDKLGNKKIEMKGYADNKPYLERIMALQAVEKAIIGYLNDKVALIDEF